MKLEVPCQGVLWGDGSNSASPRRHRLHSLNGAIFRNGHCIESRAHEQLVLKTISERHEQR